MIIDSTDGVAAYGALIDHVLTHGKRRTARNIEALDAGWVTVRLSQIDHTLPLGVGRRINRGIAAIEALQLIGSFSSPELTVAVSPNFERFREPNGSFYGAYGKRIGRQSASVVKKLRHDVHTRQAIITLWDSYLDNVPDKRDYPCTIAIGIDAWQGVLNMFVTMRSQDVWLGAPYDWFQFTQLQWTIATILGIPVGTYTHTTWSTHLYEHNIATARALHTPPPLIGRERQPCGIAVPGDSITTVQTRAYRIAVDALLTSPDSNNDSDDSDDNSDDNNNHNIAWYMTALNKHRTRNASSTQ